MSELTQAGFEEASRAEAREVAHYAMAVVARVFNHCGAGEVSYRYSDAVQSRFHALAVELVALVEHGAIEANPAHGQHLKAQAARGDKALQSLIRKASRKTPIRGR